MPTENETPPGLWYADGSAVMDEVELHVCDCPSDEAAEIMVAERAHYRELWLADRARS
jgi:hypothetical protein